MSKPYKPLVNHHQPSLSPSALASKVLLKFPTIITIVFATTCLGSLSRVYKRAQQEVQNVCGTFMALGTVGSDSFYMLSCHGNPWKMEPFSFLVIIFSHMIPSYPCRFLALLSLLQTLDISTRVAQLALRLLSDTCALSQLEDPDTGTARGWDQHGIRAPGVAP